MIPSYGGKHSKINFAYSPANNPALSKLVKSILPDDIDITGLSSSEKLEEFLFNQTEETTGVDFGDSLMVRMLLFSSSIK